MDIFSKFFQKENEPRREIKIEDPMEFLNGVLYEYETNFDIGTQQTNSFCQRENELKMREEELLQRVAKLDSEFNEREEKLAKAKAELEAQKKQLEDLTAEYKESCERYKEERRLWLETCSTKKENDIDYDAIITEIRNSFLNAKAAIDNTKDSILCLNNTVRDGFTDGIAQLCNLYRDLSFMKDMYCQTFANRLGVILMSEFDAKPIEPCKGDRYNSSMHERFNMEHTGEYIECCLVRGWSLNGNIILKAAVETKEGGAL